MRKVLGSGETNKDNARKRTKYASDSDSKAARGADIPAMPPHPHRVQPQGNLWLLGSKASADAAAARRAGLGSLSVLNDPVLLKICSYAEARQLLALCSTSDALTAFASSEELWKAACLRRVPDEEEGVCQFRHKPFGAFHGSWKASFVAAMRAGAGVALLPPAALGLSTSTRGTSIFSDTLFRSHELTFGQSAFGAPAGPPIERIARDAASDDLSEFSSKYEAGEGRPVILEGAGAESAASKIWDDEALCGQLGDRIFHAGGVNFKLRDYLEYAKTNSDDQPLYLFDPTFANTAPELLDAYEIPPHFRDDLFGLLDGWKNRPQYQWLLVGGPRSGQTWHKDPNGSSAWNLTVRGCKRWLLFPPNVTPPGVFPTEDGELGYLTPLSLAEWARGFYKDACATPGFVEAETKAGDVMFVPRGWWHMVLNVAPVTVAVSHHFTSPAGLSSTLRLLRESPHEVSGIDRGLAPRDKDGIADATQAAEDHLRRCEAGTAVHDRLVEALQKHRPDVIANAEEELLRLKESRENKRKRREIYSKFPAAAKSSKSEEPFTFGFHFGS